MLVARYKTKKELKASIGPEYGPNGKFYVVGPGAYQRKWYAQVTMVEGKISKVS